MFSLLSSLTLAFFFFFFFCLINISGRHQTAGLRLRWKKIAPRDAACVKRLKEAGAIFLAQTNVSELGHPYETTNRLYGRTNNPYDVRRTSGGSAGGAVSHYLTYFASVVLLYKLLNLSFLA